MASMRAFTDSRGSSRPASIMPSIAASTASDFIFMKSTRVLSRSKTMARINRVVPLLARQADGSPQTDFTVVDPDVEAARRVAADPRLVVDRRAVAAVVRQRKQHAVVTFAAFR